MDRKRLRRLASPSYPFYITGVALVAYLIGLAFGDRGVGLEGVGMLFVLAFTVGAVLRKVSGLSWRESLWPRLEPTPEEQVPTSMESVHELAKGGRRIEAIKMYRDLTGADLLTARDAVKEIQAQRREIA